MVCNDCIFFQPVRVPMSRPEDNYLGECRRHPPRNAKSRNGRHVFDLALFPLVDNTDWCGEFASRTERERQRRNDKANAAFDSAAHDDATRDPVAARTRRYEPMPERPSTRGV